MFPFHEFVTEVVLSTTPLRFQPVFNKVASELVQTATASGTKYTVTEIFKYLESVMDNIFLPEWNTFVSTVQTAMLNGQFTDETDIADVSLGFLESQQALDKYIQCKPLLMCELLKSVATGVHTNMNAFINETTCV